MVRVEFTKPKPRRPEMAMIYVRTKQGRLAYYDGRQIPHDRFTPVRDTPFIRRLIHHWRDLEVQGRPPVAQPKKEG